MRAPQNLIASLGTDLERVRTILAQNTDDDVDAYIRADELVVRVTEGARSILPRTTLMPPELRPVAPTVEDADFLFDNGFVRARIRRTGIIVELATKAGPNVVSQANALAAYTGRRRGRVRPEDARIVEGGLEVRFRIGASPALMRATLLENEPYLRVELAIDWRERKTRLVCEQWIAVAGPDTSKAVPEGRRFARVAGSDGAGLAMLAADLTEWSLRPLPEGGVHLTLGLVREDDRGELAYAYAYAPFERAPLGVIDHVWRLYACGERVPLFTCEDTAVAVVGTKPAAGAAGVVVRVREFDGAERRVVLQCGGRVHTVAEIDEHGREAEDEVRLEEGALVFMLAPLATRAFEVRF